MDRDRLSYRLQQVLKSVLDIVIAAAALLFLAPGILFVAWMIRRETPGGVIYRHGRIGKDGKPFMLYKFRTMVAGGDDRQYKEYLKKLIASAQDPNGEALPYLKIENDPRITRIGRLLRASYMDEVPQLLNVLKGEMSLVGPRPHVQLEVDSYTPEQRRRLTVKPGLTGPWQVEGKGHYTFTALIQSDLDYIDHWTLWRDVVILCKTFLLVMRGGERVWTRMAQRIALKNALTNSGFADEGISEAPSQVRSPIDAAPDSPAPRAQPAQPTLPAMQSPTS